MPAETVELLRLVPGYDPFQGADGCWFDTAAAAKALDFFPEMLCHIEGEAAAGPFVLSRWQQAAVANLFGWKRVDDRGREARRYRELFVYVPRKNGKALDVETPIPTPDGWKRMGDIREGDLVFDQDGRPTRVLHAFDVMHDRLCYQVKFSDGTSIVADGEHLWETRPRRTGRPGAGDYKGIPRAEWSGLSDRVVFSTADIRDSLTVDCPSNTGRVEWNHKIDVCVPLELPEIRLPIDPYVLGAWLGDGDSGGAGFTCSIDDMELIENIRAGGIEVSHGRRDRQSRAARYRLRFPSDGRCRRGHTIAERSPSNGRCLACERETDHARRHRRKPAPATNLTFQETLRTVGVLGAKHIPRSYLRASFAQRLALLQGLMDTDGTASAAGQCEYTTTCPELRDGFVELARSLGYKPSLVTTRARVNGKDCGEKYRIQFWAFADRPCFRLSRKKARLKPAPGKVTRSATRQIVAVEPVESRPVRCIAVDGPRQLYLAGDGMIPTHNSPWCAGIGLFVFFCDDEAGQQGYLAASDKDQAGLIFRQMDGMVRANTALRSRCRAYGGNAPAGNAKSFVKPDNAFLKVISADASGKHGGNPSLVIVDELHEQKDRRLIDTLRTSMTSANRRQPLMIQLTTADYDRPSICNERYQYAKRVQANPALDPAFLPVVYEADPADAWDDEKVWERCNPNLDVSVSRTELRRLANEARDNPALLIEFRRLHTNVRVQRSVGTAIDLTLWDGCRGPAHQPAHLAGKRCWAGLDLGWRDDFAALVRLWQIGEDLVFADFKFWVPEGTKRDLKATPFFEFVAGGHLEVTDGNTTDFAAIRAVLDETRSEYEFRSLFMDPSYARSEATELMNEGFPLVEFRQNMASYSIPWKWLVADGLKGKKLAHDGNPVARWMAGHVAIEVNGTDGVMPRKRKSTEKIDGITALCMGLAAWLADPKDETGNVYDGREPLVI